MTASGSVSDYADTSILKESIATAAGLQATFVTNMSITSGIITATIEVPTTTTAATVQARLSSSLATAAAASDVLGIPVEAVPLAIDELPAVLIAAACAEGVTVLRGAEELRVKESDRIASMAEGLSQLGIDNTVQPDGIEVVGGDMSGGVITTHHDHRIAMSFSMAALRASDRIKVSDCAHVATSFPGFADLALQTGLRLEMAAE